MSKPGPSNLRNTLTFPTTNTLPSEHICELTYRDDSGDVNRHWCLLGEITEIIPWPLRLSLHLKDKDGTESHVAFYDKSRGDIFVNQCKPGHTMAFLYPENHAFMDGQIGLRIEADVVEQGWIKILPFGLDTLLSANDKVFEVKDAAGCCAVCGKETKLKRCGRCVVAGYCGNECQAVDWHAGHKELCKAVAEVKWFTDKNWETFRTPFSF
ncbi:hypothetical protein K440DRAFT_606838 [Wilcoxina mikolae CBS 423.85]|nr:hypothetical protein K440DRAFT_606838 [Wilcoxina mikolae CBS 423.85]